MSSPFSGQFQAICQKANLPSPGALSPFPCGSETSVLRMRSEQAPRPGPWAPGASQRPRPGPWGLGRSLCSCT